MKFIGYDETAPVTEDAWKRLGVDGVERDGCPVQRLWTIKAKPGYMPPVATGNRKQRRIAASKARRKK